MKKHERFLEILMILLVLLILFGPTKSHSDNCQQYMLEAQHDMERHETCLIVACGEQYDARATNQILKYLNCKDK